MSLRTYWTGSLLAAVLVGSPGLAVAETPAVAAAQIDPAIILPPPPADGSAQQTAELDELRDIKATRTPDRLAQARWDDAHEDATAFASVIGAAFDLKTLPKTAALLAKVQKGQ